MAFFLNYWKFFWGSITLSGINLASLNSEIIGANHDFFCRTVTRSEYSAIYIFEIPSAKKVCACVLSKIRNQ